LLWVGAGGGSVTGSHIGSTQARHV
jgi:hypothetical protein